MTGRRMRKVKLCKARRVREDAPPEAGASSRTRRARLGGWPAQPAPPIGYRRWVRESGDGPLLVPGGPLGVADLAEVAGEVAMGVPEPGVDAGGLDQGRVGGLGAAPPPPGACCARMPIVATSTERAAPPTARVICPAVLGRLMAPSLPYPGIVEDFIVSASGT